MSRRQKPVSTRSIRMEIHRQGNDHLEVILSGSSASQQEEMGALDVILSNWQEKSAESKTCTICCALSEEDSLKQLVEAKAKELDVEFKHLSVDYKAAEIADGENDESLAEKKSHLSDLIMLASVDGQFDDKEEKIIMDIGAKMGLSEKQVNSIYNQCVLNPDQIEDITPKDKDQRLQQMSNLCRLILADGKIDDWESVLIFPLAAKMGFNASDVSRTLQSMLGNQ